MTISGKKRQSLVVRIDAVGKPVVHMRESRRDDLLRDDDIRPEITIRADHLQRLGRRDERALPAGDAVVAPGLGAGKGALALVDQEKIGVAAIGCDMVALPVRLLDCAGHLPDDDRPEHGGFDIG